MIHAQNIPIQGGRIQMADLTDAFLRDQLIMRRRRLESAMAASRPTENLAQLLEEVDAALARMEAGTYGLCEACHEPIERERLIAAPLICYCLDHLTAEQKRALEQDLELAWQIQRELLPKRNLSFAGWEAYYHYEPAGPVSGDYCDVVVRESEPKHLLFLVGDASGKGISASMLTAHLHAIFRTLMVSSLPVHEMVSRASRVFCESTMSALFATLVCGRATAAGEIEVCNAGHCPVFLLQHGGLRRLDATGVPLGMFCDAQYFAETLRLAPGDTLFLYTDGVSEARSPASEEYGEERLRKLLGQRRSLPPQEIVRICVEDLGRFRSGTPPTDDVTVMAIQRTG